MNALLEKKSTGALGAKKQERLTILRRQADELMFQKAYAALLLKWRGERVPSLNELRQQSAQDPGPPPTRQVRVTWTGGT